jgi:hypothetical protein
MADIAIILNNVGNDTYSQSSREFLTSPILTDMMRIMLSTETQLNNVIRIRNSKSFGSSSNRDISLRNYISASKSKTNLILDVALTPPLLLNGQTYFQTDIEPNSEIDLMFYFDQIEIGDILKRVI